MIKNCQERPHNLCTWKSGGGWGVEMWWTLFLREGSGAPQKTPPAQAECVIEQEVGKGGCR